MSHSAEGRTAPRTFLAVVLLATMLTASGCSSSSPQSPSQSGGSAGAPSFQNSQGSTAATSPADATPSPSGAATVTFAAMGDMLPHSSIVSNAKTGSGYDFGKFFGTVPGAYKGTDVVFCNQEGLTAGAEFGITGYPAFNAPTQFADALQSPAGCNAINLANNHIADKTQAAIDATLDGWHRRSPLLLAGANSSAAEQRTVSYATVHGVKIAMLSFAQYSNRKPAHAYSVNLYSDFGLVSSLVAKARANADVVMVSMHWGTEGTTTVNANQRDYASRLAKLGVDVVVGTGPHVVQQATWVRGTGSHKALVWYSLGNMLSTQLPFVQLLGGIAEWKAVKAPNGAVTIEAPTFTPTYMHYTWTAAQKAANDLAARTNIKLSLLKDAKQPMSISWPKQSVDGAFAMLTSTLGPSVRILR